MPECPVCQFPALKEPPRSPSGGGSYEICPSCGFQFGVDDDDKGISYDSWRQKWEANGSPWMSKGIARPANWELGEQKAPKNKKTTVVKSPAKKSPRSASKRGRKAD